jgi:hypothetical protein
MKIEDINFDELLPSGQTRFRRLTSGAIRDESTHKIVARQITSDEARAMVTKRWDKWRNAAASAVLKEAQSIDPSIKTEEQAWGFVVAKQYTAFLDSEKPRGDDLVKFGQILGAMPTIADVKNDTPAPQDTSTTYALLQELAAFVASINERQVIDVKVTNVSDI